jgi:CheY-like chemotaxis protein
VLEYDKKFDLVVMDMESPFIGELEDMIKTERNGKKRKLPVIALVLPFRVPGDRTPCRSCVDAVLAKPVPFSELKKAVCEAVP